MARKYFFILIIIVLVAGIHACHKNDAAPAITFQQPANFPAPAYRFANNTITRDKFELGRKLFYDPILSADNSIACGSCHIQTSAFTHHGHTLSHGISDRVGTRNSPPIMNLAWNTSFMWDGGIGDLDLQPIAPITNHVEMAETMENVLKKLRASPQYPALFRKAYGTEEISTTTFLKALSQFMLMCVSSNSRYDSIMRHDAGKTFTATEQEGYNIYRQKCASCHTEPLFTDHSFRNNGLSISAADDKGRYLVSGNDADRYTFRVPSLRNLAYTAPYMHDGRLLTLDAVLGHYTGQVQLTPNLDPAFTQTPTPGLSITTGEKTKLLAFLSTLNDKSFLLNKQLSEQ